jgi:hypothetical protein
VARIPHVVRLKRTKPGGWNCWRKPVNFQSTQSLLPEYEALLTQIAETRAALEKELHQALCQTS